MGKRERRILADVRLDVALVRGRDALVGHQHHHDVGVLHGLADFGDFQSGAHRLVPRRAALAQADGDLDTGIVQILRMRVTLRPANGLPMIISKRSRKRMSTACVAEGATPT